MTRKDYVAIAAALKLSKAWAINGVKSNDAAAIAALNFMTEGVNKAAEYIADSMANDNPRFDRARFLAACGVQS